ncbi:MAG: TrmH family RNA methyltransferase [Pseudomonadales bacterium]
MPATNGSKNKRLLQTITVYGRNPVLEALNNHSLHIDRLHLADSNKAGTAIQEMLNLAQQRHIEVVYHSRRELSRISRNGRQDQGVALDIYCPTTRSFDAWLAEASADATNLSMLALEGVTNPQNLGMCIRSASAAGVDAILLAGKGSSGLNPLAIKASAGTAFNAPLVYCRDFESAMTSLRELGCSIFTLAANAEKSLYDLPKPCAGVFVLGNESIGVSRELQAMSTKALSIPMRNQVESLNVAASATLVAFHISR